MSNDDDRTGLRLVTPDLAAELVVKDALGVAKADDRLRRETLNAENPMRVTGDAVGEFGDYIDACKNRHVRVEVDRASRTLRCRDCGVDVDPMSWILHAAKPVERMLDQEKYVRHEVARLQRARAELQEQCAKLRSAIATEVERASKIGLAAPGAKRNRRWNWSPDRIVDTEHVAAAITFVSKHGGVVRVDGEDGPVVYIADPSLRLAP